MDGVVLGTEKLVPALDEVSTEVPCGLTDELHPNVVPRLTRDLVAVELVLERLVELLEVKDTTVGVVFSGPDGLARLVVDEDVAGGIPSAEAEIEAAHERDRLINHTHLLVLQPVSSAWQAIWRT